MNILEDSEVFNSIKFKEAEDTQEIQRFQVFGERHSGTNFIESLITKNLPITPTHDYGWKHGFPVNVAYRRSSLIIYVVRNPIDWIVGMYKIAHIAKTDIVDLSSFSNFIRSEWAIFVRPNPIHYWRDAWNATVTKRIGRQECMLDRHPITGERFANPMQLRNAKLAAGIGFQNRDCNLAFVSYETVKGDPEAFLQKLSDYFEIPFLAAYQPIERNVSPPSDRAFSREEILVEDYQFILQELDLAQEEKLGYTLPDSIDELLSDRSK